MKKDSFTKTEVKKRGWTDTLIRDFLGEPDEEKEQRYYSTKIKLFKIDRVKKAESTKEFKEAYEKSLKRKKSAKKAIATKREKAIKKLDELSYRIGKILSKEQIERNALDHYNQQKLLRSYEREEYDFFEIKTFKDFNGSEEEYENFLKRICVNYLRHMETKYDNNLSRIDADLGGKVGIREVKIKQRNKILDIIAENYPYLAEEAQKQKW
ncbi:MAG: hypothetical protein JJU13_12565 [Balneolaceae bacterium]|nr:hypothetical protein [Balneolaceae bacterium]